jgi:hypothetical protein
MSHASAAVRINRVVIQHHEEELRGTVDLELLGPPARPGKVAVWHPRHPSFHSELLQVGRFEIEGVSPLALPAHDVLTYVVRRWMSRVLHTSIFGFSSGVFRAADCTFEGPATFVLPAQSPASIEHYAGHRRSG